jgi:TatD DNase family protein
MLVDSHCHLDFDSFREDFPDVLTRAESAGVGTMVTISTKLSTFENVRAIAEAHETIYCSVGVHPHEADGEGVSDPEPLIERAGHPKVVGIGETGLDYYYEHSDRTAQQTSFRAHIEAARQTGLPLIVHARDADEDTVDILVEEYKRGAYPGLIHCFTASQALADAVLDIGFSISFSGILTFKNAKDLHATAKTVPLDRILVETDAPYLAPTPYRGKRNEPAYVAHTARFLAELKGETPERVAEVTTENFFRLFSKAKRPAADAA